MAAKSKKAKPTQQSPEDTIKACQAAWQDRDFATAAKLTSPNLVEHSPVLAVQAHKVSKATKGGKSSHPPVDDIKEFLSVFPDAKVKIEDIFSDGNKVVYRWSGTGTHRGAYMGIPPTRKKVKLEGVTIARVVKGQIVETWRQFDLMSALDQLGLSEAALLLLKSRRKTKR